MRALITGASGFVGRHLAPCLEQAGCTVWGIDRVPLSGGCGSANFRQIDLGDERELAEGLRQVKPSCVFHMAGVFGGETYMALYEVNVLGTIRLFDALLAAGCAPRIVIASSSAVYGATRPEENPVNEQFPLLPISHYAVSKVAQEMVGIQYFHAHKMQVIRLRTFNLVGPGMSSALLASSLARQIALLERTGQDEPVAVGNLHPRRDYVDIRDAVRAYAAVAELGTPGEVYNVCSGRSYSVQQCLDTLLALAKVPLHVFQDPERVRAAEVPDQVGDPTRLQRLTGWRPEVEFETSLADLLEHWRAKVARESDC
ncbi:GDP-mannose 4,6-dehydratase [Acidobacteria bacterium AH-259-A15]|nr:GDP-mannose 4,6-dehydratase [Acidobacteria bacterium AH-259-A15]